MRKLPLLLPALPLLLTLACTDDTSSTDADETGETVGDGDGDPSGDGDGDPSGDGDGDPSGDGDGDPSGDGDGDPSGDGDGDPSGDGDGDPSGDGDGDPSGDGDGDPGDDEAMLRVVHLGLDAPAVDVYLDDAEEPAVVGIEFEAGTTYLPIPAGPHVVSITAAGAPLSEAVLVTDAIEFAEGVMYSAAAYDYLTDLSLLALVDDAADIAEGEVRLQIAHTAADVGQVDVWAIAEPPVLLVADLDFGAAQTIDIPAGAGIVGIDVDDDMIPDLTFSVPDLGAGNLVNVYAVNEADSGPVFLLAHLPDGSTARLDAHMCGNDIVEYGEVCDGTDLGGETCEDLDYDGGVLGCLDDCSDYEIGMCTMDIVICNDTVTPIPDNGGPGNAITLPIVLADVGTVANIRVSVDITHTFLADINATLDKDGADATSMFEDIRQVNSVSFCSGDNMVATLDDAAAQSIQTEACIIANTPAIEGTFAPNEALSTFQGADIAGTWNLVVFDDANLDVGQINQWCVHITPAE